MKFVSKEEMAELMKSEDESLINEILSRVYNAAIEAKIRKLPEVISRMIANTTATQAMTKDFFKRNEGFENHKDIVAAVIQDIESVNPDKEYGFILLEAEPIIKEKIAALGLAKNMPMDLPAVVNLKGNGVLK